MKPTVGFQGGATRPWPDPAMNHLTKISISKLNYPFPRNIIITFSYLYHIFVIYILKLYLFLDEVFEGVKKLG